MSIEGRRLFLLRHAMALGQTGGRDRDRELTPKGHDDAVALGQRMKKEGFVPDLVLCSSAVRTQQTLENVKAHLETGEVKFVDRLYDGGLEVYIDQIKNQNETYRNILIVGHNPTIYELARYLSADEGLPVQRLSEGYQPATLSVLNCACERWRDIKPHENVMAFLSNPTDYNAASRLK